MLLQHWRYIFNQNYKHVENLRVQDKTLMTEVPGWTVVEITDVETFKFKGRNLPPPPL